MIKEFARSGAYQVTNEPSNAQLLAKVIMRTTIERLKPISLMTLCLHPALNFVCRPG